MVNGTIRVANADGNTRLALKNCAPFTKCNLEINDEHVDTAENLDITMPKYNLIEYSDNYQDSSATLYQYKRHEPPEANAINSLTTNTSSSSKYKVKLLGNPVLDGNIAKGSVKVVVPLKYADANVFKYINLDPSFQGVNRLFVMAYNRVDGQSTRNGQRKYCLPRISLNKYNVIIDGRNFYDNPIESDIEKYRELKKVMIGKGEDYTTGSLLDYDYFDKHYKLVAVDLSKQKELDADPRAIQQIEFKYMLGTNSTIYWVLEKSKETILEFYKGTVKVY